MIDYLELLDYVKLPGSFERTQTISRARHGVTMEASDYGVTATKGGKRVLYPWPVIKEVGLLDDEKPVAVKAQARA